MAARTILVGPSWILRSTAMPLPASTAAIMLPSSAPSVSIFEATTTGPAASPRPPAVVIASATKMAATARRNRRNFASNRNVPHLFSFLVLCRKAACSVDGGRNADRRMQMVQAAKLGHTLAAFAPMIHVGAGGDISMRGASTDEPVAVAMSGIFLGSLAKIARHGFSKSAAFGYAVAVGVSGNLIYE